MKYKCLILDHDDTAVKTTPEIHYPAFLEILEKLRPGVSYSLEEFTIACFEPGFFPLCTDILGFNDEEMDREYKIWRKYADNVVPEFYDGIIDLVKSFKANCGHVCVVTHADQADVEMHYGAHGITIDRIYGREYPEEQQKPYPFPLLDIMKHYNLEPQDLIVIDDLKLGYDMARSCNVFFAAAGWSHTFDSITDFMRKNSDAYFKTVKEFSDFVLAD